VKRPTLAAVDPIRRSAIAVALTGIA